MGHNRPPCPMLSIYIYVRVVKTLSKLNQEGQSSLTSKAERIKVLEAENEYLIQKIRDIGNNWNPGIL